jgi:amino acid transporter
MSHYPPSVAAAVVIANMIGTGVFTSLGFQLMDIQSAPVLMMLWVIGGLSALCGALSYAELGAALPKSGGEYHFLTEIYHPCAGFISGWVSATVGFAAPTALAALTLGSYLGASGLSVNPTWVATVAIVLLTTAHCTSHRRSGGTQTVFTLLKLILILGFSAAALLLGSTEHQADFTWTSDSEALLGSGAFAVSLIYVNYAYSGWNAATYISGELASPQKSLPWVLGISTTVVAVLYCLLNYVFLSVAPIEAMIGKVEIGVIAAEFAFGSRLGDLDGPVTRLLLISTISAMILAGPSGFTTHRSRLSAICSTCAPKPGRHSCDSHPVSVSYFLIVSLDRFFRADSHLLWRHHGAQYLRHRARTLCTPMATARLAPAISRLLLSDHTAYFSRHHGLDPHLYRASAAGRGPHHLGDSGEWRAGLSLAARFQRGRSLAHAGQAGVA